MHHRIWYGVVAGVLLMTAAGCGTSLSRQTSMVPTTSVKSCSAGTVAINEGGTIHCLAVKKARRAPQSNNVSDISFPLPAQFHYWTRQYNDQPSHSAETLEVITSEEWWQKLGDVWKGLAPIGIRPSAALGIGIDLSGDTSASSGLASLREAHPDPAYVLFLQSPALPLSHHEATLMAAASAAIITAFSDAFPEATQWPALVVRWQGPHNEYVQLGESGSYSDAALENSGLPAPGWAVGTGDAAPSDPLSWDPTNEDLSQLPPTSSTDSLYRSTDEMVHGLGAAMNWMSVALFDWGRSSSVVHGTITKPTVSPSPSSVQTSNTASPSSSVANSPSSSRGATNYLDVTAKDAPQGIQISWSAEVGATPSKATVMYSINNGTRRAVTMQNGAFVPGVHVGQSVTILSVTATPTLFASLSLPPLQYGATTMTVTSDEDLMLSPESFAIVVGYSKSLPFQTPTQEFSVYHVLDTTTGAVGTVTAATVVGGTVGPYYDASAGNVLRLLVTFPSATDLAASNTIAVTTSQSVVHTQSGAPTITDGTGALN